MSETTKHRSGNSREHTHTAPEVHSSRVPPDELESLKSTLAQLREDMARLSQHSVQAGKAGVSAVRESAAHAVEGIRERASDLKDKGWKLEGKLEDQIADHPIAATMLAFSAGFFLARMLRRR